MSYSSSIQTLFSGPSTTSTSPPYNGLAIGPNYVVMVEGSRIEWTDLTGGSPTLQSVYSFFSPLSPTGGLYDPRVIYDSVNQRFVAIMQYLAPGGTATSIDIAVSKDANPNDGWTFSQLNTTVTLGGQTTGSDRPMLAVDGSNVYISAPQYNLSASGYAGTENWIIGDTAGAGGGIYGGGTLSLTTSEVMSSSQGIFAVASGSNGKTYYASDFSSGGQIVVALQTYDKATNTFSTTSTVNLGNIDQGGAYTAQQLGTSLLLDGGDKRIASMVYANGFLYAVAEMKPSGSSVPLVHWFKIDVSNPNAPSLVAQGDISGAAIGTSVATFNPSIAVDAAGDIIINFTASGPNMYPADYYVFQGGGDPTGSFSAPVLYQASTSFFNSGDGSSVQRWGLNSSATVDPNNPNSFWISNEYVANGWWQTSVARIAIQGSAAIPPTVSSIVTSGSGITSGAGDLNAGKAVTLTVNFSAAVTVNTSGGTPTITLNDGGTATYTGGSGSTALTFSYTVAAGQTTADLAISSFNPNGATIVDGSGTAANLAGAANYNPAGILQIDTTAPTIASIVASGTGITNGTGSVSTGQAVTLTVNLSEAVTVSTSGGTPTLTLNDGGTASYTGGSGGTALTFSYTVAAGQTTADLAISAINLNGATINDGAGNAANLSGATNYNPAGTLQVNSSTATKPSHIVVLSLENENYSDIVGSSQAPYLNSLIAQGMLLTNYNGVTHPSQPNYIALFSGSTQGITNNGTFPQIPASVPTLASTLAASGYTFGGYAETTADPERQPWIHFANSVNTAHDFSTFPQTAAGFANLPTVSYVSPNDADNMTPTSDNGGGIPAGDAWVQANLSAYAAWAQANNSVLIVTFDENNTNPAVTYPNHVAAIVVGAGVPAGAVNDSPADPYSLLATIESLYGATAIGASAGVPALDFYSATPARASTSVTRSFSGLSDPTNNPPQNALAVGPNYIFTAETTHYAITDLSGNPIVSNGSLYSLFAPLGGTLDNALLDARAAYDSTTGRYVVTVDNFQPGGGNFGTNIDIAVSVDSNPSHGWYLASIDTSNGNTTQSDMPYLSVSNGKIYISAPEFLDAGGGYSNGEFVVNESSVIAAGNHAITPDASTIVPGTASIMRNVAGDNGVTYYLSARSTARETALAYQTYDPTNGFSGTQTIFLGDADVGGGGSNFTVAQLGTTKKLDINDGRIQSLAYTSSGGHNYVYGVSEVMPSAGAPAQIEWFKLDVTDPANPQYVIGNVISGAFLGTGVAVFNPSIAVDNNGDVLINFSASGPNMYPADYYMVLGAGTSAFSAPTLYKASTTYLDSGSLNDQRWGTYSTAIADPNNPNGFWISNEYVANGWWQTVVAQIAVQGSAATAPTVSSIVTSGSGITSGAGDLNAGKVVTLTVNFSSAVTVNTSGGTPSLTLNDGGTASYTGGSGGTALTFSYTVGAGQNTADLIISAFNLNGAIIAGGGGISADLTGATNSNPAGILQIDTTAPTIASIVPTGTGITNGTGNVSTGQVVTLTVNLSEAVTVNTSGGTPTLTLNDGGTATYAGGTGSSALTFSYTVAAGQTTSDLAISALNLNGAVINDGGGNAANLSGATNYNPAGTLQVNPTAATVASIAASGTGITAGAGDLNAGKVVTLTVTFSTAVTVNTSGGAPSLALNDGGTASYTGGSGSTALTFSYTVVAGQNTADLIISAFNLNGATITGGNGLAADLTGATNSNPAGILQIDTTAPTIASIVPTGTGITNGTGNVSTGQVVTLTVNLSEAVTVNTIGGTPTLTLNDGGTATYAGGTGSSALTFSYTVAAGQTTSDLAISALNLNGAVINDGAGNAANLSGATNYNPAGVLQVNPTATTVASIASSGTGITNGVGNLNAGKVVTLTVNFSAAVTVNTSGGTPSLALNDGGTASYTGGSGSAALTFSYTVAAGQNTADLIISAFNLNGATITGSNGIAANLTGATNYNPAGTLQIDTAAPTIASIVATGTGITSGSGNLNAGKVVTLTVNFSEAVTVNTTGGTPTLILNDGGTASYVSGSGGTALTFSYTVAAGQNTADLIVSSLALNGATIADGAGNAATLSGATNANPSGTLKIDTTAPTIASIVATGTGITSGTGNVNTGGVVTLTVNLSEAVTVNTAGGTPTLALNDGGSASYISGSGTTALTFSYTVAAGQTTADLTISSLNLNGAIVNDGAGNAANLASATNYNPAGILQINRPPATIASIATSGTGITNGAGDLNAGKAVTLTVNFSAAVTVNTAGGTPRLTLNDGGTASYTGGSGSTALTFSYTVAAGQNTADLIVSSLALNGATIIDGNGNAANLAGATNSNPAGILQIDTTVPTIASIVATGTGITNGSGSVTTGQVVTLTVNLSEAVTVNTTGGTPTLALNDGGTASYISGSGSTALTFRYTVAAGQTTSDLAISSLNLNGAIVSDGAGNAANLAGAANYNPAGTLQVNPTTTNTGVPSYSHIVVVVEENHNYDEIAGSSQAPYINSLMAGGASLTNMTAEAHPSQPNYFVMYAGSTFGTTDDNSYSLPDPTLYTVLKGAGYSFTGYVDEGGIGSDFNHDPWVSFPEGRTVQTDFTSFPSLFANGNYSSLPTVSFVIPSVSNDMHNGTIAQGDTWLQQNLSAYAQWAVNNNSLLIVTWDENDDSSSEVNSNKVPTLLYGANVVSGNYSTAYNHYNLLSTITASLGLTAPNNAATAAPIQVFGTPAGAAALTTVDQDAVPESPALAISSSSLTVQAGGSVPLGITATPVDSDDQLSLSISGLPSYESITAPAGNAVTSALQSDGTYTWTIAEGTSAIGQPLTGLTLSSSYTGTDHPVATFTVTASNTTPGEAATSAPQTMTMTDPPAPSPLGPSVGSSTDPGHIDHLAALMDQFAAAGFQGVGFGPLHSTPYPTIGAIGETSAFLAASHLHTG
ncbi:alkaline phosphatase family protein [Bradyrhizobium manausense]|uniref:alkaline phosphatase family protein n=1 Tax=Bradyrhizobium manausense TaxID=989370 RepID=UPI001BACADF4|nr:hypothetical protein [Bradyrhizobium manausense]